jgi:hypothetical protein
MESAGHGGKKEIESPYLTCSPSTLLFKLPMLFTEHMQTILSSNTLYRTIQTLLKFHLTPKNMKTNMYKIIILLAVLYE